VGQLVAGLFNTDPPVPSMSTAEFLYTNQVGCYRAPVTVRRTPPRTVWAGLVGPVRGVLRFLFLFSFFLFFSFFFFVSFFSLLFLYIFSDSKNI
jgi:hypothetical protein